jgi:hypothetical protein
MPAKIRYCRESRVHRPARDTSDFAELSAFVDRATTTAGGSLEVIVVADLPAGYQVTGGPSL